MNAPHPEDKSAGFTGLILGSIAIFVLVFGIVRVTDAHYTNEKAEEPSAVEATSSTEAPAVPVATEGTPATPAAAPAAH